MKRRDFLRAGAASACAISGTACSASRRAAGSLIGPSSMDLEAYLTRLDGAREAIGNPFTALITRHRHGRRATPDERGLVQKSLRSLLLAGAYRDLPTAARNDEGFAKRVDAGSADMDAAVLGSARLLEDLTPAGRVRFQHKLRDSPDLPMRVAETLAKDALSLGVSIGPRLGLRKIAHQVSWRLRHQPASLLIDECLGKVRRVQARLGYVEAEKRASVADTTRAMLFAGTAAPVPGDMPRAARTSTTGDGERSSGLVSTGGIIVAVGLGVAVLGLGIGAAIGGLDGILPGGIGVTLGAVLLLIGLVVIIVGAAQSQTRIHREHSRRGR